MAGLPEFNRTWSERLRLYRERGRPPSWQPGLRLTPEVHAEYERFLPVDAYLRALYATLNAALIAQSRPLLLGPPPGTASIAAWWQDLPARFAGRVTWAADEVLPLACALAAPERFGTRAGRYPEQRALIRHWLAARLGGQGGGIRALDMGCGTGQGTWELAAWLPPLAAVIGVTREPLEVWMAQERRLPHLADDGAATAWAMPQPTLGVAVEFRVGDLRAYTGEPVDLLLCNGLVAGPAWHAAADLALAWERFAALLAPGGLLLVGDSFHHGFAPARAAFASGAPASFRVGAGGGRSRAWLRA